MAIRGRPSFSDEVSDGDATALARLRRSPRSAGSGFELTGKLGSKVRRTVTLQEFSGGRYVTVAIKNSTRVGNFTFRIVVLDGPATLHVRAPRHKVNPKSRCLPSIAIKPVNVDVQGQSSQFTALPPIVRQGPTPADGLPTSTPAATVATSFLASKATELGLSASSLAIREQHATPGGGTAVRVGQSYRGRAGPRRRVRRHPRRRWASANRRTSRAARRFAGDGANFGARRAPKTAGVSYRRRSDAGSD